MEQLLEERLLEACAACFALNQGAKKDAAIQATAYGLKCALARWLYAHGYVECVQPKSQVFRCYHTQEFLCGRAKVCTRCRNSNVFGSRALLAVRFRVDGCTWSWHLPLAEMPDACQLSAWKPLGRDLPVPNSTPRKLAWVVWKWLVVHGREEIALPRLEEICY